jgi:hypothetical protein
MDSLKQYVFLSFSSNSSSIVYIPNSSIILVMIEGLGFIALGSILLYLSSRYEDLISLILILLSSLSLIIGIHIFLTSLAYIIRFRRYRRENTEVTIRS